MTSRSHSTDATIDYRKFYDPEKYLLDEVGKAFRETGRLDPADFLTLLIWKAERAKNYHKKRLVDVGKCTFADAVSQIASGIHQAPNDKERLKYMMEKWWFQLPTATAILTMLYPDNFTIFDWRVCDELEIDYKPWHSRGFSDALWDYYDSFKESVVKNTPPNLTLREKDQFLIGRSNRKSIIAEYRAD